MFTMKEACEQTHLSYETLKFYCNQGLVPNVKRDKNNHRILDERDIAWINSLNRYRIALITSTGNRAFMMMF